MKLFEFPLDWANELHLLEGLPAVQKYMTRMYDRPRAAMRIAKAAASVGL